MDPLVCCNRHALFLGIAHCLSRDIYNILNWLAMMNKMAARVLSYELESPSYSDSNLKKSRGRLSSNLYAWFTTNGFFQLQQRMLPLSSVTNGK